MSLWWARRDQLDDDQRQLIEGLDLEGDYLVLGPPGSGKTNVLLRRAQFVRTQGMPNILVLTFTRSLTEFLRTGCYNANGAEIFPPNLITTYEAWMRGMYRRAKVDLPKENNDLQTRKRELAVGALQISEDANLPRYDALFVDEAQDLLPEEVNLIRYRADRLFFVGDDRQRIYGDVCGLNAVRELNPVPTESSLSFHYRLAPEICSMADRILTNVSGGRLSATSHYDGPRPGRVDVHPAGNPEEILDAMVSNLTDQVRVYGDLLAQGDRLGVVVPRTADREIVLRAIEATDALTGRAQIVRARTGDAADKDHSTAIDPQKPILILTEHGCKGLEFRALHWLFVDSLAHYRTDERYYTVVTRAKTSLDIYHTNALPQTLARSYAEPMEDIWS